MLNVDVVLLTGGLHITLSSFSEYSLSLAPSDDNDFDSRPTHWHVDLDDYQDFRLGSALSRMSH